MTKSISRPERGKLFYKSVTISRALLAVLLALTWMALDIRVGEAQGGQTSAPGIIVKNGLEWYIGPDKDTTWKKAKYWAEHLTVGGGGWRLPTQKELEGLYQEGVGPRNLDPAFKTTGYRVWASDTSEQGFKWFDYLGEYWVGLKESRDSRAFAVRSPR